MLRTRFLIAALLTQASRPRGLPAALERESTKRSSASARGIRQLAALAAVVTAGAGSGCLVGVEGTVDEDRIPFMLSAYYTQRESDDGFKTLALTLTSVMGGCDAAVERLKADLAATDSRLKDIEVAASDEDVARANESYAQTMVDYDTEHFPTDVTSIGTGVTEDDEDPLTKTKYDLHDAKAHVALVRVNDHPTVVNDTYIANADVFAADDGTLEVGKLDEDKGTALYRVRADLVDADDDRSGEIYFVATATRCTLLEESEDDFQQMLDDHAANPG